MEKLQKSLIKLLTWLMINSVFSAIIGSLYLRHTGIIIDHIALALLFYLPASLLAFIILLIVLYRKHRQVYSSGRTIMLGALHGIMLSAPMSIFILAITILPGM